MSHGSSVRLVRDLNEQLRAGLSGRVIGFYRRPESTGVVVSFAGRVATVPLSYLGAGASQPPTRS
jgi:hypothetical protein